VSPTDAATDTNVSRRMRSDWNRRARFDPRYYVALGRRNQSWEGFLRGAEELVLGLERELPRISSQTAAAARLALEIGCGPGRLMLPLSRNFHEIHGVDVSPRMVQLARQNLAVISRAHVHTADGISLRYFEDDSFDFVYSYAVFQHIPSRDVVFNYMKETRRVLRTGGVARMQFNGLEEGARQSDTWHGVRFKASEIAEFARVHDLQLLALEGAGTQYMWGTFAKRSAGWFRALCGASSQAPRISIRKITSASSPASVVPARGPHAAFALWVEGLPSDADLNTLHVRVAEREARLTYIGAAQIDGLRQVTGILPDGLDAGFQRLHLTWANTVCKIESFVRLIPPGPNPPRIVSVTDGVYVGAGQTISSNIVRVSLEGTARPEDLEASVAGRVILPIRSVCTAPNIPHFEVDFKLPTGISAGANRLEYRLGRRYLGSFEIMVTPDRFWWWRRLHPVELYQAAKRYWWARRAEHLRRNTEKASYIGS
jgi:SAM-dependent methyltransferase